MREFKTHQCVGVKYRGLFWPAVIIPEDECINPLVLLQRKPHSKYLIMFFGDLSNEWITQAEADKRFKGLRKYNFETERKKKSVRGLKSAIQGFEEYIFENPDYDPKIYPPIEGEEEEEEEEEEEKPKRKYNVIVDEDFEINLEDHPSESEESEESEKVVEKKRGRPKKVAKKKRGRPKKKKESKKRGRKPKKKAGRGRPEKKVEEEDGDYEDGDEDYDDEGDNYYDEDYEEYENIANDGDEDGKKTGKKRKREGKEEEEDHRDDFNGDNHASRPQKKQKVD